MQIKYFLLVTGKITRLLACNYSLKIRLKKTVLSWWDLHRVHRDQYWNPALCS